MTTLADKLREVSAQASDKNLLKAQQEASKWVSDAYGRCVVNANTAAENGNRMCTLHFDRPWTSGRLISEESMILALVDKLKIDGLEVQYYLVTPGSLGNVSRLSIVLGW